MMPSAEKVLALIPARGGSKGIHRKNIRVLLGKPLIAHTIEQALCAKWVGRTVVSTEDDEIAAVSQHYGAEVIRRPWELAGDQSPSESALVHVLDTLRRQVNYDPELVVFLQCTSPVRKAQDIDDAIQLLLQEQGDSLVSVTPWHGFLWRNRAGRGEAINFDPACRPRRQEMAEEFRENGSIFICKPRVLRETNNRLGGKIILFPMDYWSAIETDTLEDFVLCEWILNRKTQTVMDGPRQRGMP